MRGEMTHPDPDVLAEFRAGLITGRHGVRLAGHLAGCERCAELSDQLAEVTTLLAAVPAPPMPPHLAQRLDSVLAAETAQRQNAAEEARPHRAPAGTPRNRGFRLPALRVLAQAAAVATVLAAGGYGLTHLGSGSTSSGTASGVSSATRPSAAPTGNSSRHAAAPIGGSRAAPGESAAVPAATFQVAGSDVDYQPATLREQLIEEMRGSPTAATLRPASQQVRQCALRLTRGVEPTRVEQARYRGQPATIVVLSQTSGDLVFVAGPGCSATSSDLLATTQLPPGI